MKKKRENYYRIKKQREFEQKKKETELHFYEFPLDNFKFGVVALPRVFTDNDEVRIKEFVRLIISGLTKRAADLPVCTCLYTKSSDDMSLDPNCPVHGSASR